MGRRRKNSCGKREKIRKEKACKRGVKKELEEEGNFYNQKLHFDEYGYNMDAF